MRNVNTLKVCAERSDLGCRVAIWLFSHRSGGFVDMEKPIEVEAIEEGLATEPTMKLTTDQAQQLMDELWRCGLRPSEGSGSAGSLAATERHLADMQKIAFNLLKQG